MTGDMDLSQPSVQFEILSNHRVRVVTQKEGQHYDFVAHTIRSMTQDPSSTPRPSSTAPNVDVLEMVAPDQKFFSRSIRQNLLLSPILMA